MARRSEFAWGVSIDNMWLYAGASSPKSMIIPHIPSVELPSGSFSTAMMSEVSPADSTMPTRDQSTPSSLSSESNENAEMRRILCKQLAKQLKCCGIDFVRGWFQWNLFQREILSNTEQNYEFPLDDFVQALNSEGIRVIAVLGNGYYRFLPKQLDINDTTQYVMNLVKASREIVRHYSGQIYIWQLENEPNWWLEHFWIGWRSGLIWFKRKIGETILSELHNVVKEEDGGTTTMINLETDTARVFFDTYSKYCDLIGLDFYPNYIRPEPIDASGVRRIAREARKATGSKVLVAETGYSSGPKLFGFNESRQAEYVNEVAKEACASDDIVGLGMWRLSDTYWHSFPFQENSFGLLTRTGSPKEAWFKYVNQIRQLS